MNKLLIICMLFASPISFAGEPASTVTRKAAENSAGEIVSFETDKSRIAQELTEVLNSLPKRIACVKAAVGYTSLQTCFPPVDDLFLPAQTPLNK